MQTSTDHQLIRSVVSSGALVRVMQNRLAPGGHEPRPAALTVLRKSSDVDDDEPHRPLTGRVTTEYPAVVSISGIICQEILPAPYCVHPDRAPLLNTHQRGDAAHVIGSVSNFRREAGAWYATHLISDADEDCRSIYRKALTCPLGLSIGYYVSRHEEIMPGESRVIDGRRWTARPDMVLLLATSFQIVEVSICPIGADPLCGFIDVDVPAARSYFPSQTSQPRHFFR